MDQQCESWHEWRAEGIGSSDAPIIMGMSPWMTPFQLWEIKTGRVQRVEEPNFAMQRGNNLEPIARAHYETLYDLEMPATLAQHERYPFLRASLDGFNKDKKIVLEIKCPGAKDHALAKNNQIPEKYKPQLDHQILVTGADRVHYFSFSGTSGVLVDYQPNLERAQKLLTAELEFWKCVEFDTPPPLTPRDYKKIQSPEMKKFIQAWKRIKKKLNILEPEEARLKKEILKLAEHPRLSGLGVRIQKITRKGNIDYGSIPELKTLDLESFRKPASESWRIDFETSEGK